MKHAQMHWIGDVSETQLIVFHELLLAGTITETQLAQGRWEEIRACVLQEEAKRIFKKS